MVVKVFSFALPLHVFKAHCVAKNDKLIGNSFQMVIKSRCNYHNHVGNSLQSLFISGLYFVVLTGSINFAKTDPLVCVDFVYWKTLKKCFLHFFLKSLFFAVLGILSIPHFFSIKEDCCLHKIKNLNTLDNKISTQSILADCIETVHVFIGETQRVEFL